MDVSIAVSLIRGQMGAVVERAVNGAVEMVLAEMLRVVGVKFEELKSQVALMKRDMETLQQEKIHNEKENDNMRAKLRYTELKLKYYRQGVEEELQQHVSAAALSHIYTPTGQVTGQVPAQRPAAGFSQSNTAPSCSGQTRTRTTSSSPQTSGRHCGRVRRQSEVCEESSNAPEMMPALMSTSTESLDNNAALNQDSPVNNSEEQKLEWTITQQPNTEGGAIPGFQTLSFESELQSTTGSSTSDVSAHADSSTLPCSPPQVKQEPQQDDEVIYIKEELDQEQDGTAMFDCQVLPDRAPESKVSRNGLDWSGPQTSGINAAGSSSGSTISLMSQIAASMPSSVSASSFNIFAQYPWSRRALGFPEEYKRHRKEQQRRSWMKCREMEKTLPQPQLSEILRERREKTRLRVAKWRAKKKLQEAKALSGAAGASQAALAGGNQNQLQGACGSVSGLQENGAVHLQNYYCSDSPPGPSLPFLTSSYASVFLKGPEGGPGGNAHAAQQTVTSSSSSFPQIHFTQQNTPLDDPEIIE
ncbi:uncharacterized protein [Eucyclogobius newberryi]|uniref:uncharacterized protein isoform X2 n=1 Tax=Eucyclogobius newberryi TaxID=166745 RepID=UPI003B5A3897